MPRIRLRFALLLCVLPLLVWAAEPWKDKPSSQWTKGDVGRILGNSPWSKEISTPTTWARTGGEKFGVGPPATIRIGGADGRVGSAGSSSDPWDAQNHKGYFVLPWASSRTIRAARLRALELRGVKPSRKDLEAGDESFYELELEWDLFATFPTASEDEAAQNSYLKPSLLGVEFKPRRVEYRRGVGGSTPVVIFYFARKTVAGTPLLREGEQRIDFRWGIGPSSIQARFDPRRMVARNGQDL